MGKCVYFLLILILLTGCGGQETFETVADEFQAAQPAAARQVNLVLPEEAAVPASESESGMLYLCDGYEILLQTLPAGDLDATVRELTGYGRQNLELITTEPEGLKRYDLVWSCLGESGEQVGRAAIYDDGNYHYVLSVLSEADRAKEFEAVFSQLFGSYSLG